ncbi:unnamed protein product, partial [Allacma fusca]
MPAMSFLETEIIHSQGKQYTRPRVGARKELLPIEQKFHYVSAIKRYFPSITEYRDVRNLLISEIARIESFKERMATLPTQAEVEYLGSDTNENTTEAPIYQILTLKITDLGNRLKPERKIKNAIRNLYNDPAILSDSPTAMSLGEILVAKINEQRFHKMKKKQNIKFIDAIDNTSLKNEEPDPTTSSQLVTQKTNDPACVIPVTIGARKVALQLDTGALPNVLSRLMVKTFLEEAPNWVKFIKLKKQVQLRLANNSLIPSATHIIELQMILGNEMIKVPFYIIDAPGQTFILGRITMDYLKMKLNVPKRLVKCRPEFCERFTIPFMHTDEFQSALTVFSLVTNEQEYETFSEDISDTYYTITEQEIFEERRLAQRTFKENLRADLNMALENGSITFQQAIRGFDRLQHFADIFDLNPDKGIGKQSEKIRKLEEFEKKHTKRGKFSLSKKNDILALVGNTGLYRDFIPEYSQIVNPIYHLTKGDVPVEWTEKQQKAFETLKAEFKKDFKLQQAPKEGDLFLDTQLSDDSMNGVLFYMVENDKRIIMFISIAFKEHQKNFTLFDREIMCLVKCVQKLQMWLHGRRVHVRSNLLPIINRFREIAQTHRKAAHWVTVLNCYDIIYDMNFSNKALYKIKAPELEVHNVEIPDDSDPTELEPFEPQTEPLEPHSQEFETGIAPLE